MSTSRKTDLQATLPPIRQALAAVDVAFEKDGVIPHYVVVRRTNEEEVVMEANAAALIHLANQLLGLALEQRPGGHYHLDESGLANSANPRLVFAFKKAPWD